MGNYQNKKDLIKIGKCVKMLLAKTDFSVEDIAYMTGFTRKTINAILNGSNTDLSHIIEVAKAIGVQPMEIFNIEFDLKPRFKLSPQRLNRNLLTKRLKRIAEETDFFITPKLVKDVRIYLADEFSVTTDSTNVSVVLKRLVNDGKLIFKKSGRKNSYFKKR